MKALLPSLILASAAAAEPTAGLTLYASFDREARPDFAAGPRSATAQWQAASGQLAGACHLAGNEVAFPATCNFDLAHGTVTWWVRPDAPSANAAPIRSTLISAMNFQLMAEPRTHVWLFMTGTTLPGADFAWDYGTSLPLSAIAPERWTHIALTWDLAAGSKAVYLDGKLAAHGTTKLMRRGPGGEPLRIGAGQPGDYDEVLVWDRVLSPEEIAHVYHEPAAIAAAARALPAPQDAVWEVAPLPVVRPVLAGLVSPGEAFIANIPVENRLGEARQVRLTLTLLDLWEHPVGEPQDFDLTLAAKATQTITASFTPPRLGSFKVQATLDGRSCDVAGFGCVPPGNPPDHPFFGAHIQGTPGIAELGRRLGFSRSRVHDMQQFTWWQRIEPERGQWNEKCLEPYRALSALGYAHWGEWLATPHWAVTLADGSHPARHDGYPRPWVPTDTAAVRSYVRKTLEWFPDIREWEVWNEPNVSLFWAGSPQDYAALAAVMYDEAKRVRPEVQVYVQYGAHGPWFRDAVRAGLLDHTDGVSYHAYASTQDHPQTWAREVAKLRRNLAEAGHPDLPIVDSEGGLTSNTFLRGLEHPKLPPESKRVYDFLTAAELAVQWRVTLLAAGVKAHYYYFLVASGLDRDTSGGRFSLTDATNGPLPAAVAQNRLVWELDGGTFAREVALAPGVRCYLFARSDGATCAVLWGEDGAQATLAAPGTACDLMGNPLATTELALGATPVYLRLATDPTTAAAQLSAAPLRMVAAPAAAAATSAGVPATAAMDRFSLANEVGPQGLIPLDLQPVANLGLVDPKAGDGSGGWLDEGPYNDLSMLSPGRHEWLGVPFQVGVETDPAHCVVTLRGKTFPSGPTATAPIAVGRKVRALFFCHGANWVGKSGVTAATYVVTYADGTTLDLPVVTGTALGNWWMDHGPDEDSRTVPLLAKDPQEPNRPWRFLRIWCWENPRSDVAVTSVVIRAGSPDLTFATLGITAAVW
jgi:hypothetical protein